MARRVGVRRFEHRAAIAVDNDGGAGRRIFFGSGVVADVAFGLVDAGMALDDMDISDVEAVMMPRVSRIAGDRESRCSSGETHSTATKPPTGSGT